MEETIWIGKSGEKTSDPNSWDNGVPNYRKTAVFEVSERTEITWDLKSLGIPVEYRCDPEDVIIYISGDCMVGGSYFVPDAIRDHFESFKDESLNPDVLDGPPPGYGMFQRTRNWDAGGAPTDYYASTDANWSGNNQPIDGDTVNFGTWSDKNCIWDLDDTVEIYNFSVDSNYDGTITLDLNTGTTFTVTNNFTLNGADGGMTPSIFDCNDFNLTIKSLDLDDQTLKGGSGTITCSGDWDNSTGTFTCETSTVIIGGGLAVTVTTAGNAFYNLTISNSGVANVTVSGNLDVDGALNCSSTTATMVFGGVSPPIINTAGNVTFANGFGLTHGSGTWTFDGTTTYTDNNATPIDLGNVSVGAGSGTPVTLASDIHVGNCTISATKTFNAGGTYIIIVDGNWTNSGTFTCSTSTVEFVGTAAQTMTPGDSPYNNLTLKNSHDTNKLRIGPALDVNGTFALADGILDIGTDNPTVNTAGDVTWTSGCTVYTTGRSATWSFDGQTTYSDANGTAQNIGNIATTGTFGTALTLSNHIHFVDITINTSTVLDASGGMSPKVLYCGGNWDNPGTFTYGTSHVHFVGDSTITNMTNKNFYDVTVEGGFSATVVAIVDVGNTMTGCFTDNQAGVAVTVYINNNCTVELTAYFYVSSSQTQYVCP